MPVSKNKIWTIFAISLIILLSSLWWLNRTSMPEAFTMNEDASLYANIADEVNMRAQTSIVSYLESSTAPYSLLDEIQLETYNPDVLIADKTIYVSDPTWSGISSSMKGTADYNLDEIATDILNNNPQQKVKWDEVFIDTTPNESQTITAVRVPGIPAFLTNDACNKNGLLNSDFKEDICKTYAGNAEMIQEKCKKLSPENCKIPSCCVLIKGSQCVAGNQFGPIFASENGVDIDFSYFYHKNKCYGKCGTAEEYRVACGGYENSSTGVSKECMVKMFNNYGCPNPNPDALINDNMVQAYSLTTKQYVDDYIKKSVDTILWTDTEESYNLCYGKDETSTVPSLAGTGASVEGKSLVDPTSLANASPDDLKNYTPPKTPS
jgi:hypothetical protein